jgi:hypothetical protein
MQLCFWHFIVYIGIFYTYFIYENLIDGYKTKWSMHQRQAKKVLLITPVP